jgi:hypothetical protein
MIDFNNAQQQQQGTNLIPENTIAKARLTLKPGNDSSDPFLTQSKGGDSCYLNCEFVILEGQYAKRKVFDRIGIKGTDRWINIGKARIRAIIESAKNINPKDMSEAAMTARKINSFGELDGLEAIIKVGIEHDRNGVYQDKNKVLMVITPDNKLYSTYMTNDNIPW